jgi:hypothetical protein
LASLASPQKAASLPIGGRLNVIFSRLWNLQHFRFMGSSNSHRGLLHSVQNDTSADSEDQMNYLASAATSNFAG